MPGKKLTFGVLFNRSLVVLVLVKRITSSLEFFGLFRRSSR